MTSPDTLFSEALLLLAGAVAAAPIFRKLGLGTVLGYLAAGIVIGPVLQLITDGDKVLSFAELGVVFLLFIIGLELKPSRLWQMRGDIFGLGMAQVVTTGIVLSALAYFSGLIGWRGSLVAGFGLALSSTAFALQILNASGEGSSRHGTRAFSILLLQDLAIVPLLAMVTILSNRPEVAEDSMLEDLFIAIVAIGAMVLAGRYLLTPLFRVIARTGAREAMIAAALLVVLGSAAAMQAVGLSMAMGAFLSGVMLAESSYRHELEADIEPFRGLLLALFFMAVGLSLELNVVFDNLGFILLAVPLIMLTKTAILYGLCRMTGSPHNDAIRIAMLLPQGGEFGFVLFTTAMASGLLSAATASLLIVIVTVSMALTPVCTALSRKLMSEKPGEELQEDFEGAGADVLMIGFSRFGQIAAQVLLASGHSVTVIDHSADRIRQAAAFGFRIYFGDGTRLDVLRAAGAERARIIAICTHKRETTDRIVDLVSAEFPQASIYARAYDRAHSLHLRERKVEYELRETLESGLLFGRRTLEALGIGDGDALAIADDIRARDEERLRIQAAEGLTAGSHMLHNRPVRPEPLVRPARTSSTPAGIKSPDED